MYLHIRIDHIILIISLQFYTMVQIFPDIKGITLIVIGSVFIVRMLCEIIFVGKERPHAPKLKHTFIPVKDCDFVVAHQFPSILSSDEFRFGQKKYPLHSKPRFQTRGYVVIKILTNWNLSA